MDERRKSPRAGVELRARIAWVDSEGRERAARGHCQNFSGTGTRLDLPERLTPGTELTLAVPARGFQGRAIVKHCRKVGNRYLAGVEFLS